MDGIELSSRPTIVVLSAMGWVVRNYLLGDFLQTLLPHCRVVIFSPLADDPEFCQALAAQSTSIERLEPYSESWLHRRIQHRRQLYHFAWCGTESMEIKFWAGRHVYNRFQNFRNHLEQNLARRIAGPQLLRGFDRADHWCSLRSEPAHYYASLLDRLRPALIFSPAPLSKNEWIPVHVARAKGIPTAVAILSWDNLTTKSRLPIDFDRYIVWSEKMMQALLHFYPTVQPERVSICGAPQFDFYFKPELRMSREAFCREVGLDPGRPIIVYSGVTPGLMPEEPGIIRGLLDAMRAGRVTGNPQLLVRAHPKDDGERYREFPQQYPEARLSIPGRDNRGDVIEWKPSLEDLRTQTNTVLHGDVHMNVASTMTIDAAILDRPVINVRYDMRPPGAERSWGMRIYDYTHYRPIVSSGGVRLAYSLDELVLHTNSYLKDPALDREGRRRIVRMQCGVVDGSAGERIAITLLAMAGVRTREDETDRAVATG